MKTRNVTFRLASIRIVSLLAVIASAGAASLALSAPPEHQQAKRADTNEYPALPALGVFLVAGHTGSDGLRACPPRPGTLLLQEAPSLPPGAEAVVSRFIKSQQSRARGTEYLEGRKVVTGDLNNDGSPDLAVLYTLEGAHGSNDYNQYLAVFLSVDGKYIYKAYRRVGGRFERNMDLKTIENGTVLFDTMEYLPKDPSCCPSKKGSTQFTLAEGKLIETKPQSNK